MIKTHFYNLKYGDKFRYRRKLFIKINARNAIHLVTGTYAQYVFPGVFDGISPNVYVTPVKIRMVVKI